MNVSESEKKEMRDKIYNEIEKHKTEIINTYIMKIDDILDNFKEDSEIDIKEELPIISDIIKKCLNALIKDYIYISTLNNKKITLPSTLKSINILLSKHKKNTALILLQINNFILNKPLLKDLPRSLSRSFTLNSTKSKSYSSIKSITVTNLKKIIYYILKIYLFMSLLLIKIK